MTSFKIASAANRITPERLFSFCIIAAVVLSVPSIGAAAVYEQLEDGSISPMRGNVASKMPSAEGSEISGQQNEMFTLEAMASRSAVIFDSPSDLRRGSGLFAGSQKLEFKKGLSLEQQRMRKMATEIAFSYSRRPGVIRAGLDQATFVALFVTMIGQESNFNPKAVSPVGAKGLGQLMPSTARELGVCDIFSPRENLDGAATYLISMLEQFGSPSMALAAYNAGPAAVSRYKGIPPYRETQQYVAEIVKKTGLARTSPRQASVAAHAFEDDRWQRTEFHAATMDKQLIEGFQSSKCQDQPMMAND